MKKPAYRRRTPSEWRAIIADFRGSGLSQEAFCRQQGLAYSTFTNWLAKLREEPAEAAVGAFVEIPMPHERIWDMELQIGTHVVLRLRQV